MNFSDEFKINVNKLNADEAVLVLLEIQHPFIAEPIRLVSDSVKIISNTNTFLPMGFDLKRQDDVQGELPKLTLKIPNVGRALVRWIDSSNGGMNATMNFMLARRTSPNVIEESLILGIEKVSINTDTVTFSLIVQNNLIKRSMKYIFDTKRTPGLF